MSILKFQPLQSSWFWMPNHKLQSYLVFSEDELLWHHVLDETPVRDAASWWTTIIPDVEKAQWSTNISIMHYLRLGTKKNRAIFKYMFIVYSKASRYMALSCTDLTGALFWIGSKKIWDEQINEVKTLSNTVFWASCLHPIK